MNDTVDRKALQRSVAKMRQERLRARIANETQPGGNDNRDMLDRVARAKAGTLEISPERQEQQSEIDLAVEQDIRDPGLLRSIAIKGLQGATAGYSDEIAGLFARYGGGDEAGAVRRAREDQANADFARPKTAMAAEIGGGVLAAAGVIAAAPAAVTGGATLLGQMAAGTALGAAGGALQGAGNATEGNRTRGALIGGSLGAGFGMAGPAVATGAGAVLRKAMDFVLRTDVTGIARGLGISPAAAKILKANLSGDDPVAAADALRRAGVDGMIADSSPQASQLLDSAVAGGGPAMAIARGAVDGRAAAAAGNLTAKMDTVLGTPAGVKAASRDIATRTATARDKAYRDAYSAPIDYSTGGAGDGISRVLNRIDPKDFKAAVAEANAAMRDAEVANKQIMASIAPDGSVTFSQPLNVQQLDYLKRGLDAVARRETDPVTGRISDAGRRAKGQARDLRQSLGAAVPAYSKAVALGGDKIAEQSALDLGRSLLRPGTTREAVRDAMQGASVETKIAARQGLREAFDEAMANVKAVASDPNVEARQAITAVKEFSSQANRAKAIEILGTKKAAELFDAFDTAATQLALRTAIARGSQTAARTESIGAMNAIVQDGIINRMRHGEPLQAAQTVVQMLTNATPAADRALQQKVYAEVAKALTMARGQNAQQALHIVQSALQGAPATAAQAKLVANQLTLIAGVGIHQSAERSLQIPQSAK